VTIPIIIIAILCFGAWLHIRIGHKAGFSRAGLVVVPWFAMSFAIHHVLSALAERAGWGQKYVGEIPGLFWLALIWLFAYSRWPALEVRQGRESIKEGAPVAELERLSSLHASGALTDEEYAQAKKKLLS